jgi:hypothetical protein
MTMLDEHGPAWNLITPNPGREVPMPSRLSDRNSSLLGRVLAVLSRRPDLLASLILGMTVLFFSVLSVYANRARHDRLKHEIQANKREIKALEQRLGVDGR